MDPCVTSLFCQGKWTGHPIRLAGNWQDLGSRSSHHPSTTTQFVCGTVIVASIDPRPGHISVYPKLHCMPKLTSNTLLSSHLDIGSRDSFTLPLYPPPFANRVLSRTSPRTPLVTFQLHTRIHRTAVRSPFPALDGSHHVGLTMFTISSTRPYKLAVYIPPAPPV